MSLVGVRVEVPTNQPIVLLREEEGQRYLPIFIGPPEATAIVYALQGMETPRPMTHDLFKSVLDELAIRLQRVVITELHDGTFYAEIELGGNGEETRRISSRPSDALALAARYPERSRAPWTRRRAPARGSAAPRCARWWGSPTGSSTTGIAPTC